MADEPSPASPLLLLCPSLVGAGVERRICTLINHLDRVEPPILLALLRKEGQFLNDVPREKIVCADVPTWLCTLLRPLRPFETAYNFITGLFQIYRLVNHTKPRLLISFTLETTVPFYLVRHFTNIEALTWIISEDSNTPEAVIATTPRGWIQRLALKFFSKVYNAADHIIAVSTAVKTSLETHYSIKPADISVIHNPLDPKFRLQNTFETTVNDDYLLAVGRLVKVKQYELLLKAFRYIRHAYGGSLRLIVLGEGPAETRLRHLAKDLAIDSNIEFKGFSRTPEHYMKNAKALLVTSRQEGFSNVIVEAMAAGCAVISTRSGGPEDIIDHPRNGILVDHHPGAIADATLEILKNDKKRRQLIENGRQHVDRYLPDNICQQFDDVIAAVLADHPGTGTIDRQRYPAG